MAEERIMATVIFKYEENSFENSAASLEQGLCTLRQMPGKNSDFKLKTTTKG